MSTEINTTAAGLASEDILDVLGYADRLSVRPGQSITFHVSTNRPTFHADVVELLGGMTDADSGVLPIREVHADCDGEHPGRIQTTDVGSFARLPLPEDISLTETCTVLVRVQPTMVRSGHPQTVWSLDDARGRRLSTVVDEQGRLEVHTHDTVLGRFDAPLVESEWHLLAVTVEGGTLTASLIQTSGWQPHGSGIQTWSTSWEPDAGPVVVPVLTLAGRIVDHATTTPRALDHFNGKLEQPAVLSTALAPEAVAGLGVVPASGVLASWDLGATPATDTVAESSGALPPGQLFQGPLRAVTGHCWTGEHHHFETAPEQYRAIHFHDDDLEDAGWEPSLSWRVPDDLPSGAYSLRLRVGDETDHVPFFVTAPRRSVDAQPRTLFLVPTNTYLAYANERLFESGLQEDFMQHRIRLAPQDEFAITHPEVGLSAYDTHRDGSGVAHTSWRRPILNLRPHYHNWLSGTVRHLGADLFILQWLRHSGGPVDVATDEDLHREGAGLLDRYRVIVTGSHPEYWTRSMMDALTSRLETGGRLMYLGGNGFYWVTSRFADRPMLEIRRGNAGTRCWDSPPGETPHSATGEPGGLWRFNGFVPQQLVGVGMAAQGWGPGSSYERLPDSFDPRAGFIFEGIGDDERIGDFGHVLGGAAGDEVDRFGHDLGTPAHALRLATSPDLDPRYQLTQEELLMTAPGQGGGENELVRSDLTFFETSSGGAVFSAGSICWAGSLAWNGFDNNVARVSENVLRRFLSPEPFPDGAG